ncbi:hypothetical protein Tco_1501457 [Tanacetum coccineum]
MSSPNHSTSNIEDAFSFMNILNYASVSSDYFLASSGSSSFNSSEDSRDGMILPTFSLFYNNPYLKDAQAFYAKDSPIPPPDPITPLVILTPPLVLPSSLLFDPRYFFVPEGIITPKMKIFYSPFSSFNFVILSSRSKTTSTSEASAMTHVAIRKLVSDRVATALEAQSATMAILNNPKMNLDQEKPL